MCNLKIEDEVDAHENDKGSPLLETEAVSETISNE